MTSNELVSVDSYSRASLTDKQRYAHALAQAGDILPSAMWDNPKPDGKGGVTPRQINVGKVFLLAETGSMLGLHPVAALQSVHIIDGKPSLSANILAALVRKAGHRLRVHMEGNGATLTAIAELIRSDDPDYTFRVEWSHEDAKTAGLLGKDNWKKYERSMLKARAITEVIREGATDVTLVPAYTPEELGISNTTEDGEPVELRQHSSRPTPPAEAPVVENPLKDEFDGATWVSDIESIGSREEALALYQSASSAGLLANTIIVGDKQRGLGEVIIEVGKAFAKAESALAEDNEAGVEGEPAVLEDEPAVIAEIIED